MYQRFIHNQSLRRFSVLVLIIVSLYLTRSFMTTILLTFIFTILSVKIVGFLEKKIHLPTSLLTCGVYIAEVLLLYLLITQYASMLTEQAIQTYNSIVHFYQKRDYDSNVVLKYVSDYLAHHNWQEKLESGAGIIFTQLQHVGEFALAFFLSFMLSFFFMLEKQKTAAFSRHFLTSDLGWLFADIAYFGRIFSETFGVVIEVQLLIAIVNTAITTVGLGLIGFHQLPTLAIMIFALSLIPVAGAIVSCIPLSLIAYSTGGIQSVLYVLILILIVHCIEAYILNPKFMSSRTKLPIFYTFVILLFSEKFLGVWGLIVGIPIFTFFLEIIHVKKGEEAQ